MCVYGNIYKTHSQSTLFGRDLAMVFLFHIDATTPDLKEGVTNGEKKKKKKNCILTGYGTTILILIGAAAQQYLG